MLWTAASIDTGQPPVPVLDTGQFEAAQLQILSYDIHRTDTVADGSQEAVLSTLRKFHLRVGLLKDGHTVTTSDGMKLSAVLLFDNGNVVTDRSQSMEPPLLGGDGILDNGEASFDLRITVLSSLCRGSKFRVQVSAVDRPDLSAMTGPMRTITKLHRTPVSKTGSKCKSQKASDGAAVSRAPGDLSLEWPINNLLDEIAMSGFENAAFTEMVVDSGEWDGTERSKDELWAEVAANGSLILELQNRQAALFELLRKATAMEGGGVKEGCDLPLAYDSPEPLVELPD